MKTINKSAPAGWDLHKKIGYYPELRWLQDEHQKILQNNSTPTDLEKKARKYLFERAVSYTECSDDPGRIIVPGILPSAILYTYKSTMVDNLKLFKDYGIIDTETELDEFLREARSYLQMEEVKRKKTELPF